MNKFKLVLMLLALLVMSGTAFATTRGIGWTYTLSVAEGGVGVLDDIEIDATLVGGPVETTVLLTATLPTPSLTQNETGEVLDGDAIGYAVDATECGGFTLDFTDTETYIYYSVTVNYDGVKTWKLPVQLKFRDEYYHATGAVIYDTVTGDVTGKFRTATRWGDGCDGQIHRLNHNDASGGDPNSFWGPGEDTATVGQGGRMGSDADGDDMAFTFYIADTNDLEPISGGVVWVSSISLAGEIAYDLDYLGIAADPFCPTKDTFKDPADFNGDCIIDIADLQAMLEEWLDCGMDYDGCPESI